VRVCRDGQWRDCFRETSYRAGGLEIVTGQILEAQMKAAAEFVFPLVGEAAGADDETTLQVAACDQLLNEQAGHNSLAAPGSSASRNRILSSALDLA
jgi:hypothetical protein